MKANNNSIIILEIIVIIIIIIFFFLLFWFCFGCCCCCEKQSAFSRRVVSFSLFLSLKKKNYICLFGLIIFIILFNFFFGFFHNWIGCLNGSMANKQFQLFLHCSMIIHIFSWFISILNHLISISYYLIWF